MQDRIHDWLVFAAHSPVAAEVIQAYRVGLQAFVEAVERHDPKDPRGFTSMLFFATNHFGVTPAALSSALEVNKSTISRWLSRDNVPVLTMREAAHRFVLASIQAQLRAF